MILKSVYKNGIGVSLSINIDYDNPKVTFSVTENGRDSLPPQVYDDFPVALEQYNIRAAIVQNFEWRHGCGWKDVEGGLR